MALPASACFVVVGAGGLGCPALLALSAAEASRVLVLDHDRVESHNLQRQVLYDIGDVGAPKVEAAKRRLPALDIEAQQRKITADEVDDFVAELPEGAVVLECTDAPVLKFAFNDACLRHDVPLVIGAALRWQGQALAVRRGHACYRCVYESPPPADDVPRCDEAGVVGSGVGHVGMLMAHLALQLAAGDESVAGQLWAIDLLRARVQRIAPAVRATCPCHPGHAAAVAHAAAPN
ncbi:MAG: ThiF family adenylyltransferase [Myxococcota bacterium]